MSRRFNSLEESVNGAIEGMQEELRCFRLAVTEGDRVEKLEAENKGLECENTLLKEEKLQKDEELEKVRDKLGELEAKNKELTDSLSLTQQQEAECHTEMVGLRARIVELKESVRYQHRQAQARELESRQYQKKTCELENQLSYAEQHLCDECHSMMAKAMENHSGIDWSKPVLKLAH